MSEEEKTNEDEMTVEAGEHFRKSWETARQEEALEELKKSRGKFYLRHRPK
jgi:hypothetical protein